MCGIGTNLIDSCKAGYLKSYTCEFGNQKCARECSGCPENTIMIENCSDTHIAVCEPCPQPKSMVIINNTCFNCAEGKFKSGNTCLDKCLKNQYNKNGTCKYCSYGMFSNDGTVCKKCNSSYSETGVVGGDCRAKDQNVPMSVTLKSIKEKISNQAEQDQFFMQFMQTVDGGEEQSSLNRSSLSRSSLSRSLFRYSLGSGIPHKYTEISDYTGLLPNAPMYPNIRLYYGVSSFPLEHINTSSLFYVHGTEPTFTLLYNSNMFLNISIDEIPGVIIPKKTINELSKLLSENYENIEIEISSNKIIFYIDKLILISKLIDGNFPDYTRVIPKNNYNDLKINRENLLSAVDRVSTIANEKSPSIKFKLLENLINLSSVNTENSTATEDIKAKYDGNEIEIGFNSRYVMDILDNLESKEIKISFNDNSSPIIIQEKIESDNIYVLMPMRV